MRRDVVKRFTEMELSEIEATRARLKEIGCPQVVELDPGCTRVHVFDNEEVKRFGRGQTEFRSAREAISYLHGIRKGWEQRALVIPVLNKIVVIRTGAMYHLSLNEAPVKHKKLPAFSLDAVMSVIGEIWGVAQSHYELVFEDRAPKKA